ncbi:MAG: WYL domain-containing protein [Desulfobulbaceae bacterium]|nr:WYL domain-containing protein [Desulfobulbaceae bacterium]
MSLLERIYYFHDRTLNNRYPNSGDLVREFEVSAATAHRDIAYLRDRLLAPLEFSQKHNGYCYTEGGFRLPFEDTPRLVLLLGMLQKMAAETGLTDLPELQKLQNKLRKLSNTDNRDIDDLIHCEWVETEPVEPAIFASILNGLVNTTRLRITYRSPAGKTSERLIDPLKLVTYQGRWYILAWCCLRRDRRMFHLARIIGAESTDAGAQHSLPAGDDWLSGSFGIFKGDASARYNAEILFTGTAANIIRHQRWHPEQDVWETENGLTLRLPVTDDRELLMKVLQFGHQACILQPEGLRRKALDEIEKMAKQYKNTGK